ncbi:MAG: acylphosphatase [Anaerolineae bacterium]|nr:acylphosphatase [Anaerolineae bacterium]
MATADRVRLRAVVHGTVQGVNFRYYTRQQARRLGLTGYVRNRGDGTVEVLAEGPRRAVEELYAWLQVGPPMAEVTAVDAVWQPPTDECKSFEVRY